MNIFVNKVQIIFALVVVVIGVLFREKVETLYNSFKKVLIKREVVSGVYTEEQLVKYNGVDHKNLYLTVMGSIFDVTNGRKHYEKGATYNYFIGKDGSRAFITGNFNDESINKDHVLDMSCDELFSLVHWRDTFTVKYKPVGVLIGRYYDEDGVETVYTKEVQNKIGHCKLEKEIAKKEKLKHPPCNAAWDADTGTTVWCTNTSGGISRSWVGVPRQLYTPGHEKPLCVCVNLETDNSGGLLKEYDNCPHTSTSCDIAI